MFPVVDRLEQKYNKQIAFKRVNAAIGDGPAIMRGYRIPGHPTLLIFDSKGQETRRFIGPQKLETVEEALNAIMN